VTIHYLCAGCGVKGTTPGRCARCERERSRARRASSHPVLLTRHTHRWKKLRRIALARDGHRCTSCGTNGGRLEVHHITPLDRGGQPFDLANLATLCPLCHHREEIKA
jgi:5-methylcytosine-specific restriction endonuclease McrA